MKKLHAAVIIILISINAIAQAPSFQWAKTGNGNHADVGRSVTTDASGNSIVIGYFSSSTITFGSFVLTNAGINSSPDMFIVKYSPAGNVLWAKSAGGVNYDYAKWVNTDANGDIIVVGDFGSANITFGADTLINSTFPVNYCMFIVKYDSNGNELWAKASGGFGVYYTWTSAIDPAGNLLVAGWFSGAMVIFDDDTLNNVWGEDMFLAKFDPSGNVLWARSAGGTGTDHITSVTTDASGNVIVGGSFNSTSIAFDTVTLSTSGGQDIIIAKYDPSGDLQWVRSTGNVGDDAIGFVTVDPSGNLIATGNYASPALTFDSITITNGGFSGSYDTFITKYDSSGTVLWTKSAGGSYDDYALSVRPDANGNLIQIGSYGSASVAFGNITLINAGSDDIYIVKYDPAGNVVWARTVGSSNQESVLGLAVDAWGNMVITGWFTGPDLNFDNYICSGAYDMFIAKLSSSNTSVINPVVCNSYTSPSGNYVWASSGTNFDTIPGSLGLDSIIIINLTVNNINVTITQNGNILSADASGALYQWLDCNNGYAAVPGETNQSYTPALSGDYAVVITLAGCTDTSACFNMFTVGLQQDNNGLIHIYPNPANEKLTVANAPTNSKLTLYDAQGKPVLSQTLNTNIVSVERLISGLYFYTISDIDGNGFSSGKFLKH